MDDVAERQREICRVWSAEFSPPRPGSRVGIAIQTLGRVPLNGLRVPEQGAVCGWYLWAGDSPTDAEDFYKPLCVEHLPDFCPLAVAFLGLPPGWRFLTDGEYIDVWYDAELVQRSPG